MPTSEELLELAERCAAKLELDGKLRHVPSFSDAEDQCEAEYEELLQAIHEDELLRRWTFSGRSSWSSRSRRRFLKPRAC